MSLHFALEEFLHSDTAKAHGYTNFPSWDVVDHLHRLADTMERVRTLLGNHSITLTSGFRAPDTNNAVGGAANSAHLYGLACDFVCPEFGSPEKICKHLQPHIVELDIDQLIWEFDSWVHLGLTNGPARHQALTINNYGTTTGFA